MPRVLLALLGQANRFPTCPTRRLGRSLTPGRSGSARRVRIPRFLPFLLASSRFCFCFRFCFSFFSTGLTVSTTRGCCFFWVATWNAIPGPVAVCACALCVGVKNLSSVACVASSAIARPAVAV